MNHLISWIIQSLFSKTSIWNKIKNYKEYQNMLNFLLMYFNEFTK